MLSLRRRMKALSATDGFTLVELLVAMSTGLVIVAAAFGIITTAIDVTSSVTGRIDATGASRTAMQSLTGELNSGCLVPNVSPIQASTPGNISPAVNSDSTHLVFVSGMGDGASGTPTLHVVSYNNGLLVDTSYAGTGGQGATNGAASTWTFSSTPIAKHTLLTQAVPMTDPNTHAQYIFRYYSYANPSNPTPNSLNGSFNGTNYLATPLDATWPPTSTEYNGAPSVAMVSISWQNKPRTGWNDPGRWDTLFDTVTFRLTPAFPSTPNYPCD